MHALAPSVHAADLQGKRFPSVPSQPRDSAVTAHRAGCYSVAAPYGCQSPTLGSRPRALSDAPSVVGCCVSPLEQGQSGAARRPGSEGARDRCHVCCVPPASSQGSEVTTLRHGRAPVQSAPPRVTGLAGHRAASKLKRFNVRRPRNGSNAFAARARTLELGVKGVARHHPLWDDSPAMQLLWAQAFPVLQRPDTLDKCQGVCI